MLILQMAVFTALIGIWAFIGFAKGQRLIVNKEIGINGTFLFADLFFLFFLFNNTAE